MALRLPAAASLAVKATVAEAATACRLLPLPAVRRSGWGSGLLAFPSPPVTDDGRGGSGPGGGGRLPPHPRPQRRPRRPRRAPALLPLPS